MRQAPDQEADGELGKYHVVRPLRVGGTAAIYLAVMRGENGFSREVVIKRPLPHLVSDPRARLMFIDEAHIASRLSHPNICQVLDLVSREDELYLVLEYLQGVDLREILKRCVERGHLMPLEVAVFIAIEVCAGLDFAHEAVAADGSSLGIVHRDVSPKNIRITYAGSVKVIDFGIARAVNRATETLVGTIKGTLGYMSPEQIMGEEIDRRADIFAFGVCLFQMITGVNPFDGPSLKERVRRLTLAPIPSVREFLPVLDAEIEAIVARTLDRDVARRYPRMRDVQEDLDRYLAKRQIISPRQRLIEFLEEIFPDLRDTDRELNLALTEIRGSSGKIDSALRLRFPGDIEAPLQVGASPGGTVSTVKEEPDHRDAVAVRTTVGVVAPQVSQVSQVSTEVHAGSPHGWPAYGLASVLLVLIALALGILGWIVLFEEDAILVLPDTASATDLLPERGLQAPSPTAAPAAAPAVAPTAPPTPTAALPPASPPTAHSSGLQRKGRELARLLFLTGGRLEREGHRDDARLLYLLAYHHGGGTPDSAIYRNLGLAHHESGAEEKARACLRQYLDKRPSAADGDRIRTLLASYPALRNVACVEAKEISRAKRWAARSGALLEGWLHITEGERP